MSEQCPFDTNFDPPVGLPELVAENLTRIVAPNAAPMTFTGTNTYLLGRNSIAVIDPGPDNPMHVETILASVPKGAEITEILITHAHSDHSASSARLSELTGAPVRAFGDCHAGRNPKFANSPEVSAFGGGEGVDSGFSPDLSIASGELIKCSEWTVEAIWTPGHFGNHLSFAWLEGGALFSGDVLIGMVDYLDLAAGRPCGRFHEFNECVARPERISILSGAWRSSRRSAGHDRLSNAASPNPRITNHCRARRGSLDSDGNRRIDIRRCESVADSCGYSQCVRAPVGSS